jgi:hypothetical protein
VESENRVREAKTQNRTARIVWFLGAIAIIMAAMPLAGAVAPSEERVATDMVVSDLPAISADKRDLRESLRGSVDSTGRVTVEVVHRAGADSSSIISEIALLRGSVLGSSPGVTLVKIPPVAVPSLEKQPNVEYVRPPLRVDLLPGSVDSSGSPLGANDVHVTVTNASAWQAAGYQGDGVKVGIVDYFDGGVWSSVQTSGDVPAPAGTFCRAQGSNCDIWSAGSRHGVAVAEIVHDMAPGATLYLATVVTVTDLAAAVAWFDSQGVEIISRSLTSELDGPGDGTGSVDAVVDDAISRGMAWFNAAGNHASASGTTDGGYWRGEFVDTDGDGWLEFAPGDEHLGFLCGFIQGLRWSDWQATGRTDYDLYIVDSGANVLATSLNDQTAGAPPIEVPNAINCDAYPVVFLMVALFNPGDGTDGDILEFMVNQTAFEYSSNPYSASGPAGDSANTGLIAVGAIDPAAGAVIAPYSSQGPTNDGRIKPDLTAPSCLPNAAYAPSCFNGTSAATPVAAGAAALVWGSGEATTPQTVGEYMRTHVVDRGIPGPDSVYGTGEIILGDPPPSNSAPQVSAGPDQTVTMPTNAVLDGTVTDDGLPSGSISSIWTKVNGPGTVTFDEASSVDTHAGFSTDGTYTLRLTADDGALTSSDDVVITVLPQAMSSPDNFGLVDPSMGFWNLYDRAERRPIAAFYFGNPGDFPFMGDWDCDGVDTPGLYRQSDGYVYLRNSNTQGNAEISFFFGNPGDVPVAGDFNANGCGTVSVYRPSQSRFYVVNELGTDDGGLGPADYSFLFGNPGDKPFIGDFDGNGQDTVGLHRESTGLDYYRNTNTTGNADQQFIFGNPGDGVFAGDWTENGVDSPGLFRPSNATVYLRYENTQGNSDESWTVGEPGWLPVAGSFG